MGLKMQWDCLKTLLNKNISFYNTLHFIHLYSYI